jgi:hypothetical protein
MTAHTEISKLRNFQHMRKCYVARVKLAEVDPKTLSYYDLTEKSLFVSAIRAIKLERQDYNYLRSIEQPAQLFMEKWKGHTFAMKLPTFNWSHFFKQVMP